LARNLWIDDAFANESGAGTVRESETSAFTGPSVFGSTMVLRGDLTLAEDLIIEGSFDGSIRQQGDRRLSIGEHARVKATIRTGSAVIAGVVDGDVHGTKTVVVKRTATLHGALTAERLCLDLEANLADVILSGSIAKAERIRR
jgi:cytoskeletal protein CcmA (bactofilin family)